MMGQPELVAELEKEELGPLISTEGLEKLQGKYVQSVRVSGKHDKNRRFIHVTELFELFLLNFYVAVAEECV